MEVTQKSGKETLINKSLVCAVQKEIFECWEGATFPKEYNLLIKFRGSAEWVRLNFENSDEVEEIYEAIKKDLA